MSSERVPAFAFNLVSQWVTEKFPPPEKPKVVLRDRSGAAKLEKTPAVILVAHETCSTSSPEVSPPERPATPKLGDSGKGYGGGELSVSGKAGWAGVSPRGKSPKRTQLAGSARHREAREARDANASEDRGRSPERPKKSPVDDK